MSTYLVSAGLSLLMIGCAATHVRPGAERIIVSKNPAPKGCKFMGTVIGEQGGAFSGRWTSNRNLAEGAMNDMKNKAFDLGANYVSLENSNAGQTISASEYGMSGGQTDVTHAGNAYRCDPKEIGLE
jgi:uncharacterized protein YbjQ (UPF0145 family)